MGSFYPGYFYGASGSDLAVMGGRVYFAADSNGVHGRELWWSDGTEAGTTMVEDLLPGPSGSMSTATFLRNHRGNHGRCGRSALLRGRRGGVHGTELWKLKMDGMIAHTSMVLDIFPGQIVNFSPSGSASNLGLAPTPSTWRHSATRLSTSRPMAGCTRHKLWKSDGTATGTVMVRDLFPGSATNGGPSTPNGSNPTGLTAVGDEALLRGRRRGARHGVLEERRHGRRNDDGPGHQPRLDDL